MLRSADPACDGGRARPPAGRGPKRVGTWDAGGWVCCNIVPVFSGDLSL